MQDNDEYIPCEICGEEVTFSSYIQHVELCQHRSSVLNILNPMLNSFLQTSGMTNLRFNFEVASNNGEQDRNSNNVRLVNIEDLLDSYEMNNIISEMIGNVNHGVVDIDDAITKIDLDAVKDTDDNRCSICLEYFIDIEDVEVMKTRCNHYFCGKCITKWLRENRTCPLCCYDFNEIQESDNEAVSNDSHEQSQEGSSNEQLNSNQ